MTQDVIQEVVQTLFDQGLIKKERRQIMRCACGNVEYVSGVVLRGTRKTLLKGEIAACCNSPVTSSDEEALVTAPLPSLTLPETHPSWAASEMRAELDRLEGVQLLISRKTRRIVTVRLEGRSWWLDNDFLWWPYLWKAYQEEAPIRHLVTGASVVRQTCLLLAFSRLIGIPGPHSVHCLPKVHFKSVWGLETPEQLVERFDVSRVQNALIWAALSGRKEFTLQETTISCMNPYIPIDIPLLQSRRMLHV
ncbi:hypothetical protein KTR10_01760 [Candidatus Kaiserbacteria bacterium]|nr:hypothetical protein [Candidatus Kaiserbacteria bacterium]